MALAQVKQEPLITIYPIDTFSEAPTVQETITSPELEVKGATLAVVQQAPRGDKYSWMSAAGIPESDWQYVDYIVTNESGWNPCAYYPSQSDCNAVPTTACGLAQSLPCGKQSKYGHWTDPVANLKWQHDYVKDRYGGYAQAYSFWTINRWY